MKKPKISLEFINPVIEKIGKISRLQRVLICLGVPIIIIGAFAFFSYWPNFKKISSLNEEYDIVAKKLVKAKQNANDLKKYEKKIKAVKAEYLIAMQALPDQDEIPSLLSGITRAGKEAGLVFLTFNPKKVVEKDFYAEIPVSIKVVGVYHNVATFFDSVSRLPRVVNIKNINIKPSAKGGKKPGTKGGKLTTTCTAVTYKFIDEKAKKKKPANKRKKKR